MNRFFSDYWWIFLLRGIFLVILALLAFLMPGVTFTTLILFLGAYLLVDGIFTTVAAINARKMVSTWGWWLVSGLAGIFIGIITFFNPFATGIALLYLVAFWIIVAGVAEIAIAIRLRHEIKGEGWYIAAGVLTVIFGILIMANPAVGVITLTFLFGIYALIAGIVLISLGIRLRKRRTK